MCKPIITLEDICEINRVLIEKYGGCGVGFNNENLAISAIEGCEQEVFGEVLYPSNLSKINHIVFSIIANHVFLDGNKRTGAFVLNLLLTKFNYKVWCDFDIEFYILGIANSKLTEIDSYSYLNDNCALTKPFPASLHVSDKF